MVDEDRALNCSICQIVAPENLTFLKESWICPLCADKPLEGSLLLKDEMERLYHNCRRQESTKLLYISDLSNNLSKINNHFKECVDLDNPFCTITLTLVEGIDRLNGGYDVVFIDQDINGKDGIVNALDIKPTGVVKFVEPIKQIIL